MGALKDKAGRLISKQVPGQSESKVTSSNNHV